MTLEILQFRTSRGLFKSSNQSNNTSQKHPAFLLQCSLNILMLQHQQQNHSQCHSSSITRLSLLNSLKVSLDPLCHSTRMHSKPWHKHRSCPSSPSARCSMKTFRRHWTICRKQLRLSSLSSANDECNTD